MDEFIKALVELLNNPFTEFLQSFGLSAKISKILTGILIAFVSWQAGVWAKRTQEWLKNRKTARELVHFRFSYKDVKQKRDLYISTHGQNNSPTYEEEPKQGTKFIVKKPLIPFFIKTAFNEKKESDKFYLVLADSGMGKTTFMINLYLQYHSLFNFRRKYKMKLFPFGDKDIIKWIREVKSDEARDTILLLDAFDEYKALLPPEEPDGLSDDERFRKRLDEVIESVKDFREVVITSRTQYFPGQEDKPYELEIPRYGSAGFHTLAKLYLSPFEEKEIKRYLNKKYGVLKFWNYKKKQTAAAVVRTSPKLMVRPMLLSYIDFLVDGKQKFENSYQIYQTLIEKWLEREADKRKAKAEEREKFKRNLYAFSRRAALEIYQKQKENSLLSKEEAIAICNKHNIKLYDYEITGQSLLTRDASQNWKFAHKSILEYFLAKEAIEKVDFWTVLAKSNFAGMDMTKLFYEEAGNWIFVKGGAFLMGSPEKEKDARVSERPQHEVTVSDFYIGKAPVTQKQWYDMMGSNPSHFKDNDDCPVENVSWNDVQSYINKLNEKTGMKFRLPTEAEWEYAARGGKKSKGYLYAGSDKLNDVGWYGENSKSNTYPVAGKKANELGLHDMSGNVWEWCQDKWHDNYKDAPNDGSAWEIGESSRRVIRGGSWYVNARYCRSANRSNNRPGSRNDNIGFRLVFVPPVK